jgi:hypothetical protein
MPNIKSISQGIAKKVVTTVLFRNYGMTDMGNSICPGHLVAGTLKVFPRSFVHLKCNCKEKMYQMQTENNETSIILSLNLYLTSYCKVTS